MPFESRGLIYPLAVLDPCFISFFKTGTDNLFRDAHQIELSTTKL